MNRLLARLISPALVLAVATSCGGDSHDALADDTMGVMKEMVTVLEGVSDKASAEAAKPDLEALAVRMDKIKKRGAALGEADEATQKRIMARMTKEMAEFQGKIMSLAMKMAGNPEIEGVLGDAMRRLDPGR